MITMSRVAITSLVGGNLGLRGLVEFRTLAGCMFLFAAATTRVADLRIGTRVVIALGVRMVRATSKQGMDG